MSPPRAYTYVKRSDITPGDLLGGPRLCITATCVLGEVILLPLFCSNDLLETSASQENACCTLRVANASKAHRRLQK